MCTRKSLDMTMVNDMVREVYVNAILPKKVEKDNLQDYRSDAAVTITTATLSGRGARRG